MGSSALDLDTGRDQCDLHFLPAEDRSSLHSDYLFEMPPYWSPSLTNQTADLHRLWSTCADRN